MIERSGARMRRRTGGRRHASAGTDGGTTVSCSGSADPRLRPRTTSAAGPSAWTPSVLDVGCGTGIASQLFLDRGCEVVGVEPDERMAAVARRRGVSVVTGP